MADLVPWWLKLQLRPEADAVLVAHVQVPRAKLLSTESLAAADIERLCGGAGLRPHAAAALAAVQALLQQLGRQDPGQYLLAHGPDQPTCLLFRALPPDTEVPVQVRGRRGGRGGAAHGSA